MTNLEPEDLTARTQELAKARDDAEATWNATIGKPETSLEQLWSAWLAWRTAAHVYYAAAGANAGNADNVLGMAKYGAGAYLEGQDRPRPRPMQDYSTASTWDWAVTRHLALVADAALRVELADYGNRDAKARREAAE